MFAMFFVETARRMRKKSKTRGNGPSVRIRFPALDGCDTVVPSRGHGSRFRGGHARWNQSTVPATHEIDPGVVLSGGGGTGNTATLRNGNGTHQSPFPGKCGNLLVKNFIRENKSSNARVKVNLVLEENTVNVAFVYFIGTTIDTNESSGH